MPQLLGFALSALVPSQGRAEAAGGVLAVTSVQVEAPEGCRDNVKHYLSSTDDPKSLLEAGEIGTGSSRAPWIHHISVWDPPSWVPSAS